MFDRPSQVPRFKPFVAIPTSVLRETKMVPSPSDGAWMVPGKKSGVDRKLMAVNRSWNGIGRKAGTIGPTDG